MANICSVKQGAFYDPACLIAAGEHPNLDRPSYVAYEFARTMNQAMIDTHRFGNMLKATADFSDELRIRIGEGLLISDHATPKLQKYWRENHHL